MKNLYVRLFNYNIYWIPKLYATLIGANIIYSAGQRIYKFYALQLIIYETFRIIFNFSFCSKYEQRLSYLVTK